MNSGRSESGSRSGSGDEFEQERTIGIGPDEARRTLADIVRAQYPGMSWNRARSLVRSGRVTIDGECCREHAHRLELDQEVRITPRAPARGRPQLDAADVLHVDVDIVVVRKHPDIVTAPFKPGSQSRRLRSATADDGDSLVARTAEYLRRTPAGRPRHRSRSDRSAQDPGSRSSPLGVVQRLDKSTSGLVVFARTRAARKALEQQFRDHEVDRTYVALAHGEVEDSTLESYLVADRGDGLRGSWRGQGTRPPKHARYAKTTVFAERRFPGQATLVSCQLATGRQNQIRIHLAEAGHPLLGERTYGRDQARPSRLDTDAKRAMLHARRLGFRHPRTGEFIQFDDPPPQDFRDLLARLEAALSHQN